MFVLTIPEPGWLARLDVPVMIGAPRLRLRKRLPESSVPSVVIDSGAYTQLHHHGRWTIPAAQYADELAEWCDALPVVWAAPQDWPCEPGALAMTGRSVAYHQAATIESVQTLHALGAPVVPVLQGWTAADYLNHVGAYVDANIDLTGLVGIGSTCRQRRDIGPELRLVAMAGIRPHAFGVKSGIWHAYRDLLASADSMAWSYAARRRNLRLDGCRHNDCRNCYRWARSWYESQK